MAKLSDKQRRKLEELEALRDAPDDDDTSRNGRSRIDNVTYTIDLSDEKAVERAVRHGLLTQAEADKLTDDDDTAPPPDDDPKRKLDKRYQ